MRIVLYVTAALLEIAVWFNSSTQGHRIQRQMTDHPPDPAQHYAG